MILYNALPNSRRIYKMKKEMNKKAQDLSIGTLILIVLGIVVLVLLILGFSIGWQNLFGKIGIYQNSDLSALVSACQLAVTSQSQASYCEFKKVTIGTNLEYVNCEDSRIKSSLGSNSLNCGQHAEYGPCLTLLKNKIDVIQNKDTYNGKTCSEIVAEWKSIVPLPECTTFTAGLIKAKTQGSCTGADFNLEGYVAPPSQGKCCIRA